MPCRVTLQLGLFIGNSEDLYSNCRLYGYEECQTDSDKLSRFDTPLEIVQPGSDPALNTVAYHVLVYGFCHCTWLCYRVCHGHVCRQQILMTINFLVPQQVTYIDHTWKGRVLVGWQRCSACRLLQLWHWPGLRLWHMKNFEATKDIPSRKC